MAQVPPQLAPLGQVPLALALTLVLPPLSHAQLKGSSPGLDQVCCLLICPVSLVSIAIQQYDALDQ